MMTTSRLVLVAVVAVLVACSQVVADDAGHGAANQFNFNFAGMLSGSGGGGGNGGGVSGSLPSAALSGTAMLNSICEAELAQLTATLESPINIAAFGKVAEAYIAARATYTEAAEDNGVTAVVIETDATDNVLPDSLGAATAAGFSEALGVSLADSCSAQLALAKAQIASTALEVQQLLAATTQYRALTAAMSSGSSTRHRSAASRAVALAGTDTASSITTRTTCPTTTRKGIDWKVFAFYADKTTRCDGSYSVRVVASALGYGMVDTTCDITSSSSNTCAVGTRYGISVGFASAYLYFGIIYNGGHPAGVYFKPQVCYNFIFTSDCADTTLNITW